MKVKLLAVAVVPLVLAAAVAASGTAPQRPSTG